MSADLSVRYSDVMQAERDFNNLTKSSSSGSSYNDSTLSVRDARKRFEQLSSSTTVATPSYKKNEGGNSPPTLKKTTGAPPRPAPPSKLLKKRATDSELHSLRTTDGNSKGQSAAKPSAKSEEDVVGKVEAASDQDACSGDSPKPKRNFKTPVKKSQSTVMSTAAGSSSSSSAGREAAASPTSSLSKKLFKRKSNKDISTVDHSANGRTSNKSSPASSPVHESPVSARRRKNQGASSNPTSSTTTEKPSTPVARKHGRASLQKSFSDKVLLSGERSVQASLKDDDKGKVVGGDKPTAPRVIEDGELKLNLAKDLSLTGAELKKILYKQLAYLSGGLESSQHLILTFPDVGLKHLDTSEKGMNELFTTIIYFKSLISIKQLSAGFTLIFDAHSTKTHNATKAILDCVVRPDFPLTVHMVCIYMKSGIFGRNKSLATSEVCSKLHMATFGDLKTLLDQIGVENLTPDLGGTLDYDHATWVSNRLEFEKMQALHRRAMTRVPDVTEALSACSVPTSVPEAEHLMTEDLKLKENLVNKIAEAELNIDRFLVVLKEQGREEENVEVGGAAGDKDEEYVTMRKALEGMLKDLKASQGQFDGFWTTHKARVDHMMRMCYFKRTAEKLGVMIKGYIDDLTSGGVHLGDTLESSLELGEKHEAFVTKCKSAMEEQLDRVREDADVLTKPRFGQESEGSGMHEATQQVVETVKKGIEELNTTHQQLVTMCQQKRDLFIVCVKFHMTTRQCAQWNEDVLEFLASQPMESPSLKQANTLVTRIDDFLLRVQPSQVQSLQELAVALPGEKFFQRSVQKTKQKYEHSCELLTNRKAALLKVISATSSPMPGARGNKGKKNKHDKDKDKPDIEILNNLESSVQTTSNAQSTVNPEASLFLAKTLVSETTEYADGESDEAILKKRMFVYKELIATEEDYIKDLETVIHHYYDAMEDDESMPLRLRGKRDVVFGNLPEIYKFHDVIFKKALEQYGEHPERIGECFVQFTSEFQMYSVYCKNRSNSETLLNESTESEAFFKGMQRNLGHQLPLNSYLLKPVQRITKYQLLIKDMMKHSVNAKKAHTDLQQALDRMLKVLKNLNDSLHVVGLKGFPGALAEQGRLLVHDAFQVWEGAGSATRSIFSRATKSRHVFLFEKVIIFSKKIEAPAQQKKANKSDNYLYKGHLELAELVLREKVDGQPLQFSLTLHGQNKQYRFQAMDKEIHTMWTSEIRRLLQVQFMLMKDMVMKSGTLDKRAYKGKTRRARDTRLFGDSFKERPGDANSKKSISNRFKLLKKRKVSGQELRSDNRKKSDGSVNSDSPLLASSSFPANIRYGVKSPLTSPTTSSLTHSTAETIRSIDEDTNSLSSEDEISFSEEEDEGSMISTAAVDHYESLAPGAPRYYTAISSYSPGESDDNGVSLCLDQEVEVIGINQFGWWWVRATNPSNGEVEEGWVPASYLKVSGDIKAFKEGWV